MRRRISLAIVVLITATLTLPIRATADSISGIVDLTYTDFSSRTTDATGQATRTESRSFLQRYSLLAEKTIFPKLRLDAGAVFERDLTKFKTNDAENDSTNTRFRPFVTLTLRDPLYTAGVGYFLRDERQEVSQSPSATTVSEDYNAFLGWKPVGLPSTDLRVTRTNTYDRDRLVLDTTKDNVSVVSQYSYRGVDLRYSGAYLNTKDRLNDLDTLNVLHSGRGTYAGSFMRGRLNFSTSYDIVHNTTRVSSRAAGGTVSTQIFPFRGLSMVTDAPTLAALDPNPALIDGNLTVGAGLNVGGRPRQVGDSQGRNAGLDFLTPTRVNNLLLWVDRDIPQDIAANLTSFSFDIYTSSDNLNWTLLQQGIRAPFGPLERRFDIDFANVTTRYVKLVVRPLDPAVPGANGLPDIFVTELQAFMKRPVTGAGEQEFVSTSQISNTSVRYRILDVPLLFYDASYFFTKRDTSAQELSTLSNGLSVNHRLTRVLTGTARVAREDGTEQAEKRTAYVYDASIMATPLRTLTNSLVFGGRNEYIGSGSRRSMSVFVNNTAQLYRGVDLNLNGGVSSSTDLDRSKTKLTTVTLGANVIPHRTMTWGFNMSYTDTERTVPGSETHPITTRRADVTVAYNPFRTLYLTAGFQFLDETGQGLRTLQNYGLNFSPFPDGALQFRFTYNETRRPEEENNERIVSPGLRYRINRRSFLDLIYQSIRSETAGQVTDSKVFTANLKVFL